MMEIERDGRMKQRGGEGEEESRRRTEGDERGGDKRGDERG